MQASVEARTCQKDEEEKNKKVQASVRLKMFLPPLALWSLCTWSFIVMNLTLLLLLKKKLTLLLRQRSIDA